MASCHTYTVDDSANDGEFAKGRDSAGEAYRSGNPKILHAIVRIDPSRVGALKTAKQLVREIGWQGDCVLGVAHYQLSGYLTFPISEKGRSPHNSARPGTDCQDARPRSPADSSHPCRRGDRVATLFCWDCSGGRCPRDGTSSASTYCSSGAFSPPCERGFPRPRSGTSLWCDTEPGRGSRWLSPLNSLRRGNARRLRESLLGIVSEHSPLRGRYFLAVSPREVNDERRSDHYCKCGHFGGDRLDGGECTIWLSWSNLLHPGLGSAALRRTCSTVGVARGSRPQ
jgi:hypothetical protein